MRRRNACTNEAPVPALFAERPGRKQRRRRTCERRRRLTGAARDRGENLRLGTGREGPWPSGWRADDVTRAAASHWRKVQRRWRS